ncbi:type II toxin-antitoxin system RelE/ParE family toxin [Oxalobacteraceae bacterium]|nr:type II toxin-antitoxin system RelE/ParE family toxin [Oxalobacteraceae bacterium]
MAYTVSILDWAKQDIADNINYLKQKWGIAVAKAQYTALMDRLALLATQPHMGATIDELVRLGRSDYRVLTHETHTKVLYRIDDKRQHIDIQMVFGSRQSFQDLLYKRVIRYL